MIIIKSKEISRLVAKGFSIAEVRKGAKLFYQAVRSCFGKGFWIGSLPWRGDDVWKS